MPDGQPLQQGKGTPAYYPATGKNHGLKGKINRGVLTTLPLVASDVLRERLPYSGQTSSGNARGL